MIAPRTAESGLSLKNKAFPVKKALSGAEPKRAGNTPYRSRTGVTGLRIQCPRPLDEGGLNLFDPYFKGISAFFKGGFRSFLMPPNSTIKLPFYPLCTDKITDNFQSAFRGSPVRVRAPRIPDQPYRCQHRPTRLF